MNSQHNGIEFYVSYDFLCACSHESMKLAMRQLIQGNQSSAVDKDTDCNWGYAFQQIAAKNCLKFKTHMVFLLTFYMWKTNVIYL